MTLTPQETQRVWEGLYVSEVHSLYFAHLSSIYQKQSTFMTWCALVLSGGAAVTFVSELKQSHPWVPTVLAFVTAGLSAYSVIVKKERKGIDSSSLRLNYAKLGHKYDLLFRNPAGAASEYLTPLEDKRLELSQSAHSFANRPRLMDKSQNQIALL